MRALSTGLAIAIAIAALWLCFDNVFSDNASVRELAERAACAAKPCKEHHGLVHERRTPWQQTFDYAWRDATLTVTCRRAYYVAGERRCKLDE